MEKIDCLITSEDITQKLLLFNMETKILNITIV